MAQLFDKQGNPYQTESAVETVRLRARGYTDVPPEKVVTFESTQFHPEGQKIEDVLAYMAEHPEDANRVIAEEQATKKPRSKVTEFQVNGLQPPAGPQVAAGADPA